MGSPFWMPFQFGDKNLKSQIGTNPKPILVSDWTIPIWFGDPRFGMGMYWSPFWFGDPRIVSGIFVTHIPILIRWSLPHWCRHPPPLCSSFLSASSFSGVGIASIFCEKRPILCVTEENTKKAIPISKRGLPGSVWVHRDLSMLVPKRANYQYRYRAAQYRYWYPYSNSLVFSFLTQFFQSTIEFTSLGSE